MKKFNNFKNEYLAKLNEAKNEFTDLIICDVQENFKKFFNNTYLIKLRDYAENFNRVFQIYDTIDGELDYYFPNQIEAYEKEYGGYLEDDMVEHYFYDDNVKQAIYNGLENGFSTYDKFEDKRGGYFIYIGHQHEWFYCEKELVEFCKSLKDREAKVCLVGGAEGECIYDIYVTLGAFGVDVKYNPEFVYSFNGCKFQEENADIELDQYLREIEIEEEDIDESINVYEEIPEDMEVVKLIDIFTDMEEVKENYGKNLKTTNLTHRQVDRNDILWITCLLKPRNSSLAYQLGEMGVIKVKVLETYYGLNKLKQLKASDKIL